MRPFVEFCPLEEALQTGVPAIAGAIMQPISSPEEVARIAIFGCASKARLREAAAVRILAALFSAGTEIGDFPSGAPAQVLPHHSGAVRCSA